MARWGAALLLAAAALGAALCAEFENHADEIKSTTIAIDEITSDAPLILPDDEPTSQQKTEEENFIHFAEDGRDTEAMAKGELLVETANRMLEEEVERRRRFKKKMQKLLDSQRPIGDEFGNKENATEKETSPSEADEARGSVERVEEWMPAAGGFALPFPLMRALFSSRNFPPFSSPIEDLTSARKTPPNHESGSAEKEQTVKEITLDEPAMHALVPGRLMRFELTIVPRRKTEDLPEGFSRIFDILRDVSEKMMGEDHLPGFLSGIPQGSLIMERNPVFPKMIHLPLSSAVREHPVFIRGEHSGKATTTEKPGKPPVGEGPPRVQRRRRGTEATRSDAESTSGEAIERDGTNPTTTTTTTTTTPTPITDAAFPIYPFMAPRFTVPDNVLTNNYKVRGMKRLMKMPYWNGVAANPLLYDKMAYQMKMFPKLSVNSRSSAVPLAHESETTLENMPDHQVEPLTTTTKAAPAKAARAAKEPCRGSCATPLRGRRSGSDAARAQPLAARGDAQKHDPDVAIHFNFPPFQMPTRYDHHPEIRNNHSAQGWSRVSDAKTQDEGRTVEAGMYGRSLLPEIETFESGSSGDRQHGSEGGRAASQGVARKDTLEAPSPENKRKRKKVPHAEAAAVAAVASPEAATSSEAQLLRGPRSAPDAAGGSRRGHRHSRVLPSKGARKSRRPEKGPSEAQKAGPQQRSLQAPTLQQQQGSQAKEPPIGHTDRRNNRLPFLDPSMMGDAHRDHLHRREMPNDFPLGNE